MRCEDTMEFITFVLRCDKASAKLCKVLKVSVSLPHPRVEPLQIRQFVNVVFYVELFVLL